eukprot:TRINITY_DN612_c1_g1_i1.p1 TRINITY_DN612_c1_g1~~TRINITY_DN612_c1_g1_i1.p1  ORF type:complete len:628 (+),score=171.07 TRINITY_DN612_c1_g1_i1:132-2015(+)
MSQPGLVHHGGRGGLRELDIGPRTLYEDLEDDDLDEGVSQAEQSPLSTRRVVVRKTFLEVDDFDDDSDFKNKCVSDSQVRYGSGRKFVPSKDDFDELLGPSLSDARWGAVDPNDLAGQNSLIDETDIGRRMTGERVGKQNSNGRVSRIASNGTEVQEWNMFEGRRGSNSSILSIMTADYTPNPSVSQPHYIHTADYHNQQQQQQPQQTPTVGSELYAAQQRGYANGMRSSVGAAAPAGNPMTIGVSPSLLQPPPYGLQGLSGTAPPSTYMPGGAARNDQFIDSLWSKVGSPASTAPSPGGTSGYAPIGSTLTSLAATTSPTASPAAGMSPQAAILSTNMSSPVSGLLPMSIQPTDEKSPKSPKPRTALQVPKAKAKSSASPGRSGKKGASPGGNEGRKPDASPRGSEGGGKTKAEVKAAKAEAKAAAKAEAKAVAKAEAAKAKAAAAAKAAAEAEALAEAQAEEAEGAVDRGDIPQTTVMLRNLPDGYSRNMVSEILAEEGMGKKVNFVYVPMNFRNKASFGYAFVNLVDADAAEECRVKFEGFTRWKVESTKVCEVSWSDMHQGLEAHIDRYRNSPVMHESVPDPFKPAVFDNGVRIDFPPPTKALRPPRIRRPLVGGEEDEDGAD